MQSSVENLGQLQRRINIMLPLDKIDDEVESRLKHLARTAKMHGFRPGKVPLKVIAQQYGAQVRQEVLGDALQKSFSDAVREQKLRVAGQPKFEAKPQQAGSQQFECSATFEIYPEVKLGDISGVKITRPVVEVGEEQVAKTLELLRKQRTSYHAVEREARERDQVTLDFHGTISGQDFAGGHGKDLPFVLGEARLLPGFEKQIAGMRANETKTFELTFPEDYHDKELAGKTASFEITLKRVAEPKLPEIDAEFAGNFGVHDGDMEKLKREIKSSLLREVKSRVQAGIKDQAMQALLKATHVDLPQSLLDMETQRLIGSARKDLESRGIKTKELPAPREVFEERAKRRVTLGLIIAELVKTHDLRPKPEQVRAVVEAHAQSHPHPEQVVKWYYSAAEHLSGIEAMILEDNVVEWVMKQAKAEDRPMNFDELMGNA
ncbi:MAG TPA: trigger factor [Burkholderiales bacterium]|nr:trigger factor [Burkholderiales bacterium]